MFLIFLTFDGGSIENKLRKLKNEFNITTNKYLSKVN